MFNSKQSGYILPQDFTVLSTVFDKVVSARGISRQSDAAEYLAQRALHLFMSGTRNAAELEARLKDDQLPLAYAVASSGSSGTTVVDLLPELFSWARSLTGSETVATRLTEETLEYAIDHVEEFVAAHDVRKWMVGAMLKLRLGHPRRKP